MGIWAGIKHALNSTLGTDDFKPLDEIIRGQRTLAASDATIAVISGSQDYVRSGAVLPSFVAKTKGVVRVTVSGAMVDAMIGEVYLLILRDGNKVESLYFSTKAGATYSVDVSVEEGSEISFEISKGVFDCKYIHIGAQIVDGSLFEVKETT